MLLSGKNEQEGVDVMLRAGLPELYVPTNRRMASKENSVLDGMAKPSAAKDVKAKL